MSVPELQKFLKDRGVQYAGLQKKNDLKQLCQQAEIVGIDVDPDGMFEDIDVALADKLRVEGGSLTSPTLCDGIADMSSLPVINIIDIYNYLMTFSQYDHATLRHYYKMEGYTMHQDGFVIDLQTVLYADHPDYVVVKSKVKPRTKDKDTRTHLTYYCVWIIFVKSACAMKSASCNCKGGRVAIFGFCSTIPRVSKGRYRKSPNYTARVTDKNPQTPKP
jgi:hypothetical protein